MTVRRDERGRADTMAMLPPPPTKPITLPYQRGFSGGEKKIEKNRGKGEKKGKSTLSHVLEGRARLSYWKIGLTTMAATQELLSGMPLVL